MNFNHDEGAAGIKRTRIPPWVVVIGSCLVTGTALLACKPRQAPLSGIASLGYVGISATNVEFRLENGLSKTISFRGEYTRLKGADPWDTQVYCEAANGMTGYAHSIGVGIEKPESIEVSPGERMRLLISSDFTVVSRGAHCRLRLTLEDQTIIYSSEFVP